MLSALRKNTLSLGNEQRASLALLEDSEALVYGDLNVTLPYSLVGEEQKEFELSGNMTVKGVAYDEEALLAILKTELLSTQTPGKRIIRIDEESVSIDVQEADDDRLSYKFTAAIQGVEEFEIDEQLEGGSRLSKKIKEHIAGLNIEEARLYIQNLPEVNKVEISVWPSWSPTIPKLTDNIRIRSL